MVGMISSVACCCIINEDDITYHEVNKRKSSSKVKNDSIFANCFSSVSSKPKRAECRCTGDHNGGCDSIDVRINLIIGIVTKLLVSPPI